MLQWAFVHFPKIQIIDVALFMDVENRQTRGNKDKSDIDNIVQSEIIIDMINSDDE